MKDSKDRSREFHFGFRALQLLASAALAAALVLPGHAAASVTEGINQLAGQIVARSVAADRTTIAIAAFPHVDDTCSELSNFLVDELVLSFFSMPDNQLSIIERSQLDRIFSELELSLSGAVDANTTQELGRVHGVQTLLVGTLSTVGDHLRVNARLIDTETARVYSAAAVNVPLTSTFEDLMRRPAAGGCTMRPSSDRGATAASPGPAQHRPAPSFEISLPDIDKNFEIASLVGHWSGQLSCKSGVQDRSLRLFEPSRVSLHAWWFHQGRTGSSSHAVGRTTFSYDMAGGNISNRFILNVGPAGGIPLQLIAKDVLYGEFTHPENNERCTLYLGKYN